MNVPYRLEVEADKHAAGAAQNSTAVRVSENGPQLSCSTA